MYLVGISPFLVIAPAMLYPKALKKPSVCDIISLENMLLKSLSPLGEFCGQMQDMSKVILSFSRSRTFCTMQSFKKLSFKNADTETKCCIFILIPPKTTAGQRREKSPSCFNQSSPCL